MEVESTLPVLMIGLEQRAEECVARLLAGTGFNRVTSIGELEAGMKLWSDDQFVAVLCGPNLRNLSSADLASRIVEKFPATAKFFVTMDNTRFEARVLREFGFAEVFLLPVDHLVLRRTLEERIAAAGGKSFRAVQIFDLEAGSRLEFDTYVFLPLNKKYLRFTAANQDLDPAKLARLSEHHVNAVFVEAKDMDKFYQYAADKLSDPGSGVLSATERHERLRASVRMIFGHIFDPSQPADSDAGKEAMTNCMQIIANYISRGKDNDWYQRLLTALGEAGDCYGHATNLSALGALFAIGIGHEHPENVAMAGLFHDLGLTTLPDAILNKPLDEMTPEEKKLYYMHADKSIALVKTKQITLDSEVEKAVLQHHERYSGDGYPSGLAAQDITLDAQLLSFVDQFDDLTRIDEGKKRMTPMEAFISIEQSGSIDPSLLEKIKVLLDPNEAIVVSPDHVPVAS